jgi:hypothetical protein
MGYGAWDNHSDRSQGSWSSFGNGWNDQSSGCNTNNSCPLPDFVQQLIDAAGSDQADCGPVGSGVSDGCWGSGSSTHAGTTGKVGSGVTWSTRNASNLATNDNFNAAENSKTVVLGNGTDTIGDTSGNHDTFVVGAANGDQLFDSGTGSNNTFAAGNGNGDTLSISSGSNNLLQAGDGAGDVLTISGAASNNSLLAGNGAGDSLSVGTGDHNSLVLGNEKVTGGSVTMTGGGQLSVVSGNYNLLKSSDDSHNQLGTTLSVGTGDSNWLQSGNAAGDVLSVGTGNSNYLMAGNGAGDNLSIGTGDDNTLIAGDGAGVSIFVSSGSNNILAAGDGAGDNIQVTSGDQPSNNPYDTYGGNTLSVGDGAGDIIQFGSGDNNSVYTGNGQNDVVSWGTGFNTLVAMGNGAGDSAAFGTGGCNTVTLGDGAGDSINLNTNGQGVESTLVVGNGANDIVATVGDNNLLQSGNGNGDVLGIGFAFSASTMPNGTPQGAASGPDFFVSGFGNNNVLEAGNGNGDVLFGGSGNDLLIAGNGTGNASYDTTSDMWSGTWGDTLTGNGFDAGSAAGEPIANTTNFDAYVLSCQGGSLAQDTCADFSTTLDSSGNVVGAVIVNLAAQAGGSSSGGSDSDDGGSCGSSYGGNSCGSSSSSSSAATNAIDITDLAFTGTMSASLAGLDNQGGQLWSFSNGQTAVSVDLFGQFIATDFQFMADTGITNQAGTYATNGVGAGASGSVTDAGGTLISYQLPQTSGGSGGSSCGSGGGSSGGSSCGGGDSGWGGGSAWGSNGYCGTQQQDNTLCASH